MQPNQVQPNTITGYMPTQLPSVSPAPPNQNPNNNGLTSLLPGQGGFS